jgi:hypothetical protein
MASLQLRKLNTDFTEYLNKTLQKILGYPERYSVSLSHAVGHYVEITLIPDIGVSTISYMWIDPYKDENEEGDVTFNSADIIRKFETMVTDYIYKNIPGVVKGSISITYDPEDIFIRFDVK